MTTSETASRDRALRDHALRLVEAAAARPDGLAPIVRAGHPALRAVAVPFDGQLSEPELVALAVDLLREFGFSEEDFVVRVSDRDAWLAFLRAKGADESRAAEFLPIIDKLERDKPEVVEAKLAPFGAFVEIAEGVEALLPTMEISDQPVKLQDAVAIGQEIQAIIKRFRPQERKISLSIKDLNRGAEPAEDVE